MTNTKTKWNVNVWEYERGWGAKIDFTEVFDDYDSAKAYVDSFNSKNTAPTAPDWYMQASEPIPVG